MAEIYWKLFKKPSPEGQFQTDFAQSILGWMLFKFIKKSHALFIKEEWHAENTF